MSNVRNLMADLRRAGIKLWLDDDQNLRFKAPKGALTPALKKELIANKPAVIEFIQGAKGLVQQPKGLKLVKAPGEATQHLSFAQERLFFLDRLGGAASAYNLANALHMRGELDVDALKRALDGIVARHDLLRSAFIEGDNGPTLQTEASLACPFSLVDLQDEAEIEALVRTEAQEAFDLSQPCALRVKLLRLAPQHHLLLATMHHIISDGWSMGIFTRELAQLYKAACGENTATIAPLPFQYQDYVHSQRLFLNGEAYKKQLAWWEQALRDAPAQIDLPFDRPRSNEISYAGGTVPIKIDMTEVAALQALAQRKGSSLFMVLMSGFQWLLARYANQNDVNVATPIANRNHPKLEAIIGFFVNTLVFRSNVDEAQSFEALLDQVQSFSLDAFANQDVPFEHIVEALKPERSLGINPLAQVMFVLQTANPQSIQLHGLELEPLPPPNPAALFDLTLELTQSSEGLWGSLSYSNQLFDAVSAERMTCHFQSLLKAIIKNPAQKLCEVSMLSEAERTYLLQEWQPGDLQPIEETFDHYFNRAVAETPDAEALVYYQGETVQRFTYKELAQRANGLAHELRKHGVGEGQFVAILANDEVLQTVAILGVLLNGSAFLPMDPKLPSQRRDMVLDDAKPVLILAEPDLIPTETTFNTMALHHHLPLAPRPPQHKADPSMPIYLIYTSGSTGKPKGVPLPHVSVLPPVICDAEIMPRYGRGVRTLSYFFDYGVLDIIMLFFRNGCLVCVDHQGDMAFMREVMRKEGVHLIQGTPSFLRELFDPSDPLPQMSLITYGGEAASKDFVERLYAGTGPDTVQNQGYGPTEAAINCTWATLGNAAAYEQGDHGYITMGLAVIQPLYVLNAQGALQARGLSGELYIGTHLAYGYLNRPALTAQSFVPNPFSKTPGDRLYRTGDLVRMLNNNELLFLGRIDHQVKLRGFRLELGEIERHLCEAPGVEDAVVFLQEGSSGNKYLSACVQMPDEDGLAARLRDFLSRRLPDYMVPSAWLALESFPRAATGKRDVKKLKAHPDLQLTAATVYVAAQTEVQGAICQIWQELLGLERVGIHDNFFDIGGHSLAAMRVTARLRAAYAVALSPARLFEAPTPARLAALLEPLLMQARSADGFEAVPRDGRTFPLSDTQKRLFFIDQFQGPSATYNMPMALIVRGQLHTGALRAGLCNVVRRNEALRTHFQIGSDGQPQQVFSAAEAVMLPITDLSHLHGPEQETEMRELWAAHSSEPFILTQGPLLRVGLLRLEPERHLLMINQHHIISDGFSVDLLIRQLIEAYQQQLGTEPHIWQPAPLQPADIAWHQAQRDGKDMAGLQFWREQLIDMPPQLELPTDKPRPNTWQADGAALSLRLEPQLVARLTELAKDHEATRFMVLLAGWQALLSRYSNQNKLVVGTPILGRRDQAMHEMLGFFADTLAMPAHIESHQSVAAFLAQTRKTTLAAFEHEDVSFEKVVEAVAPERNPAHNPIFQAMLAYQSAQAAIPSIAGLSFEPLAVEQVSARMDLSLVLEEAGDEIVGVLEFSTCLFETATMERLLRHYVNLLGAMADYPSQRIACLNFLDEAERRQLISAGTPEPAAIPAPVHQRFAEIAEAQPKQIAMIGPNGEPATYGEIHGLAQRITTAVLERSQLGERVAMLLDNGPELVACWQGILSAGRVILPLDPSWPTERMALVIGDGDARFLITDNDHAERASQLQVPVLGFQDLPNEQSTCRIVDGALPAYMVYTSGSTGRPKGVAVCHRNLADFAHYHSKHWQLQTEDRGLLMASPAFDGSVVDFWPALTSGSSVATLPTEARGNAPAIQSWLIQHGVTHFFVTTVLGVQLIELNWPEETRLRLMVIGGEKLNATPWGDKPFIIANAYGPTETTVIIIEEPIEADEACEPLLAPPRPNCGIVLMDRHLELVPDGVVGEMCIAGSVLSMGYMGRPALTALTFLPDPHAKEPGQRLYRSGDLALRTKQRYRFMGRRDHQVKLRGFRIELGEIEAMLTDLDGVHQATVLVKGTGDRALLVAYVVAENETSAAALREQLERRLPAFMVPAQFIMLERLPLSPTGKLDRRALAALEVTSDAVAAETQTQEALVAIWAEVLQIDAPGITDNFFELGGHSLLVGQVLARIEAQFGLRLPVRAIFERGTIQALATLIDEAQDQSELPAITPCSPELETLPLSFAQMRLWLLDKLVAKEAYNMPFALRLYGPLDRELLLLSFEQLCQRHEMLRTTLEMHGEQPRQRVWPRARVEQRFVDLIDDADAEDRARDLAREDAVRAFELAGGVLTRFTLVRIHAQDHLVLLNAHHIASDGWSMGILMEELSQLYNHGLRGQVAALPALPVQYGDYCVWQEQALAQTLDSQEAYWQEKLSDIPAYLNLPIQKKRPQRAGGPGGRLRLNFDAQTSAGLEKLALDHEASLFMVLQSIFALLLGRYSGQDDFCLGTPVAGRQRAECEGLLGLFVNTLVLRQDLGVASLGDLIAATRNTTLDALAHQDLPFERVVDLLQPERHLNHTPLFQVMCSMANLPLLAKGPSLDGLAVHMLETEEAFIKFDVVATFEKLDEGITCILEYNRNLFDDAFVVGMGRHLQTLAASTVRLASQPSSRLAQIDHLAREERAALLAQGASQPPTQAPHLPEAILAAAARKPEAIALRHNGDDITYAALIAQACGLAQTLRQHGIGPEAIVAVACPRDPSLVIACLGTWLAGAAFLPLDLGHPQERLNQIIAASGAKLLLSDQSEHWPDLPRLSPTQGTAQVPPVSERHPASAAYVIFTSGSTGQPKGVVVHHAPLARYIHHTSRLFAQDWTLGTALHGSPAFDATHSILWPVLICGGRLDLLSGDDIASNLRHAMGDRYAVGKLTPGHLKMLRSLDEMGDLKVQVDSFVVGAEAFPVELASWARKRWPHIRLYNQYGPTEITIACAAHLITELDPQTQANPSVPIGQTMAGAHTYILDKHMQPVANGVHGTLYVGGPNLARGYLGNPRASAQVFLPNPFATDGGRLYNTGDRVLRRNDGALVFIERADRQLKRRGYRIEPGEIEAVLNQLDGIDTSAVILEEQLLAYVVGKTQLNEDQLKQVLAQTLPIYMVPDHIVMLDSLPMNRNGKLDRKALPQPKATTVQDTPEGPDEQALAQIWSQLLNKPVGRHDNFFHLGGDSILAIQVISRANRQGLGLEPRQLFEHQTIAGLARVIRHDQVILAEQGKITGTSPLLPAGAAHESNGGTHHYNQSLLFALPHAVHVDALREALHAVWSHHDVLHAAVRDQALHFAKATFPGLEVVEVSDSAALTAHATQVQASHRPAEGRMSHFVLYHVPANEHRLLISFHHHVVDGVSWRILLEDLQYAYDAFVNGNDVKLPPKTTSLAYYARSLAELAQSDAMTQDIAYWLNIATTNPLTLPRDHQGSRQMAQSAMITRHLDVQQTQDLLGPVHKAFRTEINDVLLTALTQTITAWTQQPLYIHMEGHGRDHDFRDVDITRTVGWFTAVYPLILEGKGDSLSQNLPHIKEQLRATPNKGKGFGMLRYLGEAALQKRLAAITRPEISFNYLGQLDGNLSMDQSNSWRMAPESVGPEIDPHMERQHLLDIGAAVSGGQLQVYWTYSPGIHDEPTIARLADDYMMQLQELIAYCMVPTHRGVTPSDFPLASLNQTGLQKLVQKHGIPEDLYAAAPLQQGMLFHSLTAPEAGLYINQLLYHLDGLKPQVFHDAWSHLIARHPILRTSFEHLDQESALQFVHPAQAATLIHLDWQAEDKGRVQVKLEQLKETDRKQGFQPDQPGLMRLYLIQIASDQHLFMWSHHHALLDGWSVPLIMRDLMETYQALHQGQQPQTRVVSTFKDYIQWLGNQDLQVARDFWQDEVAEVGKRVRPLLKHSQNSARHQHLEIDLDTAETRAIQDAVRHMGVTANTLVQSAWALTHILRGCGSEIVIGVTVAGRPPALPGVEEVVGPFINTLPARTTIEFDQSARQWLPQAQQTQAQRQSYGYLKLSQIQKLAPSGNDLFDSLYVFENYPQAQLPQEQQEDQLSGHFLEAQERGNYPLVLLVSQEEQLGFGLHYDANRLDEAQALALMQQFRNVLQQLYREPDRPLSQIQLMDDPQRQAILLTGKGALLEDPQPHGLAHHLFEEQARRHPDHIAMTHADVSFTYRELNERANDLASRILKAGGGPEKRLLLPAPKHPHTLLAFLAAMKAGTLYIPFDPQMPVERRDLVCQDARPHLMLFDAGQESVLPNLDLPKLPIIGGRLEEAPQIQVESLNAVYMIYTSGSTGRPKGVLVAHHTLRNYLQSMIAMSAYQPGERALAFYPFYFDGSTGFALEGLSSGLNLCFADQDDLLGSVDGTQWLHDKQINHAVFIPSVLAALAYQPLPHLKTMIVAGDACSAELANRWARDRNFYNVYGPTEATVAVTAGRITPPLDMAPHIGKAIANAHLCVVDPHLNPLPLGIPGELLIAGQNLSRGYWMDPARTASRFVPADFTSQTGARAYRSGDLVKMRGDGRIDYLGRIDQQIKIRGFRVELGEIEAVLQRHGQVSAAIVLLSESQGGRPQLVAFATGAARSEELVVHLHQHLPDYMVPEHITVLDQFPRNANSKIDRKALQNQARDLSQNNQLDTPIGERETQLAAVWCKLLNVAVVGRQSNFFHLGGDSILALQLSAALREQGIALTPQLIFQNPSLAGLAQVLDSKPVIEAPQTPITGQAPLTPIQSWFFEQDLNHHHWNMSLLLGIKPEVPVGHIVRALSQLIQHHDALRTLFHKQDGVWVQEFQALPNADQESVSIYDLSQLDDAALKKAVEDCANQAQQSLNIMTGPVFKPVLMVAGPTRPHRLMLAAHHLVIDAVSWRILIEDFQRLLDQLSLGQEPQLPKKTSPFKAWAEHLQQEAQSPETKAEHAYWQTLADQAQALPCDPFDPSAARSHRHQHSLSQTQTQALLRSVPATYGNDMSQVLLVALHRALQRSCLRVNLEAHGRDLADSLDASRTVGWFTNMYPVCLNLPQQLGLGASLQQARDQIQAIPRRGMGYGLLPASIKNQLQAQIGFNYLGQLDGTTQAAGSLVPVPEDPGLGADPHWQSPHRLDLSAVINEGAMRIAWTYNPQYLRETTIQTWSQAFLGALQEIIRHSLERPEVVAVDRHEAANTSLLKLHDGGPQRPLFCIHPLSGSANCFEALAQKLGGERPIFGLSARGLMPGLEPHQSIQEMARYYIAAIKSIQPVGPYHLLGWSAGAIIAYEMTQQLNQMGETVAFFGNIDCGRLEVTYQTHHHDEGTRLARVLEDMMDFEPDWMAINAHEAENRLEAVIKQAKMAGTIPAHYQKAEIRQMLHTHDANQKALANYHYQPMSTKMTLIAAETVGAQAHLGPNLGWDNWAPFDRHEVPGHHTQLVFEPFADGVAAAILACLE